MMAGCGSLGQHHRGYWLVLYLSSAPVHAILTRLLAGGLSGRHCHCCAAGPYCPVCQAAALHLARWLRTASPLLLLLLLLPGLELSLGPGAAWLGAPAVLHVQRGHAAVLPAAVFVAGGAAASALAGHVLQPP